MEPKHKNYCCKQISQCCCCWFVVIYRLDVPSTLRLRTVCVLLRLCACVEYLEQFRTTMSTAMEKKRIAQYTVLFTATERQCNSNYVFSAHSIAAKRDGPMQMAKVMCKMRAKDEQNEEKKNKRHSVIVYGFQKSGIWFFFCLGFFHSVGRYIFFVSFCCVVFSLIFVLVCVQLNWRIVLPLAVEATTTMRRRHREWKKKSIFCSALWNSYKYI